MYSVTITIPLKCCDKDDDDVNKDDYYKMIISILLRSNQNCLLPPFAVKIDYRNDRVSYNKKYRVIKEIK